MNAVTGKSNAKPAKKKESEFAFSFADRSPVSLNPPDGLEGGGTNEHKGDGEIMLKPGQTKLTKTKKL